MIEFDRNRPVEAIGGELRGATFKLDVNLNQQQVDQIIQQVQGMLGTLGGGLPGMGGGGAHP